MWSFWRPAHTHQSPGWPQLDALQGRFTVSHLKDAISNHNLKVSKGVCTSIGVVGQMPKVAQWLSQNHTTQMRVHLQNRRDRAQVMAISGSEAMNIVMRNASVANEQLARAEQVSLKTAPMPANGAARPVLGLRPHSAPETRPHSPNYPTLTALFEAASFQRHCQPDSTILLHGESADALYQIVSGTVRCCMISAEGNRQIPCFSTRKGFIGITEQDHWHFTAEAVDHVVINVLPRSVLERELKHSAPLQEEIRAYVDALIENRDTQLLTLVSTKASERVFRFLRDFAAKRPSGDFIALPMCRRDIADHLGLSVETVSRAFSNLKRSGRIDLATCEKYRITSPTG